jgi:hypothetical protein
MAKIWPVYEGREPTTGGPWADLPVSEAAILLEFGQEDFLSDLAKTPRFGDVDRDLRHHGFKNVVIEIEPGEGRRTKWRPGFYRSHIAPEGTFAKLIQHAAADALGKENVVDVKVATTADSQGQKALKITVVIAPDAIQRLDGDRVLNALVKIQDTLNQMGDGRTPIVEYATEAELDGALES